MKKKLMIFVLTTLFFSLVVTTVMFIIIANFQHTENLRQQLNMSNEIYINLIMSNNVKDEEQLLKKHFTDTKMRVTYVDRYGRVLADSMAAAETMENHNDRKEIIEAREKGIGSSIRYSSTVNRQMLYSARVFNDGSVMRSAIPLEYSTVFHGKYLEYYMITMLIVVIAAAILSSKLSYVIIKPIRDLEYATSRVARGELDRRVSVHTNDEVGQLGRTFNDMAERLQITIKDSLDKQNRLEAILKSMDSGVIAVDRNYKIIMINPYAKKIFGISKDIIGENLMDNIRDFEFENVFKFSDDDYKEIKILWPKESVLRIKTADIINQSERIGTVAVVQDITDIKRLENMRTEFVANVSHELKTPLTSIKGFAETLKYVEDTATREKFLNIINDESERLTRLINDILALSDIELHKEDKKVSIDVSQELKNVVDLIKNEAEKKQIQLQVIDENVPKVQGDQDKFKQMLLNLVDNAVKYSENGNKVIIGGKKEKGYCVIWVEDTGVGIPKEHIPRLFERFYRVDKARSRAKGGTGLGLAIVKHIVLGFNGTITVESEVGKGSKFIVKMPLK
jgi:two-component system, OmpR family, phosphate regulon sensor histidine kinase PhoR